MLHVQLYTGIVPGPHEPAVNINIPAASSGSIAKKNGVRYSELIRLPYFDAVRMASVDPMHAFLLGMVKREVKFVLKGMTPESKRVLRVKSIRLPHDIGTLSTIFDDDEYEFCGVS